jgi:hypothetical protein
MAECRSRSPLFEQGAGDGQSGGSSNLKRAREQEDVMARKFGASFQRIAWLSTLTSAFLVMSLWPLSMARAQVIERGVQGGVVGAIIGGIVGGGRGAGTGAAIGAGVGIVTGAAAGPRRNCSTS